MTIKNSDFDYIRVLLRQQVGMVLGTDKAYFVETRLTALAQQRGLDSLQDLLYQLRAKPSPVLHQAIIDAMAINETRFFRDEFLFEKLKTTLLPEVLKRQTQQKTLNIWSAACSSGQEAYSIVILLKESFPFLRDWQVRLIASDISHTILARADEGDYTPFEVNRGLSHSLLNKYFHRKGKNWQIKVDIRQQVEFKVVNLMETTWPLLPKFDMVFLRNVLIYFDEMTKKNILNKVFRVLKPGGYLVTGTSETALHRLTHHFQIVKLGTIIVYQVK
jgi:chemotaxis protein methyltransferase CheR